MKKRILTGDRPTGPLHLGHYVGSLKKRVELQTEFDQYILVADVQALTDNFENPQKVADNILQVALDYLSVGIDPALSTLVIQSQVAEIAELTVFLMNLVTVARLERNPTLKSEIKEKGFDKKIPVGFFVYPISQVADITAFGANLVPVGADQLPMIEQTKEIVERFNRLYGETLVIPEALVSEFPRLPGTDGKAKMSKSIGNVINLSDSADDVVKKVKKMYTDPSRVHPTDPGTVDGNPVFIYHDAFNPDVAEVNSLKERYLAGTVGDVEVKERLALAINTFLDPIRARRAEYEKDPGAVMALLKEGTEKGRAVAHDTLTAVKKAMKIDYFG